MSEAGPTSPKPVVTLFESYGSGAEYIGPRVAEALGLPYHQQAFSSEELEQQESQRENDGLLARVLVAMGMSTGEAGSGVPSAQRDQAQLVTENTVAVREWAQQGGVIVGRNGAFILAGLPSALHVRLDGPVDLRVERAAADRGISVERAQRRQRREDQIRVDMSRDLYGFDSGDPLSYDLVLNTGRIDLDTCVAIIVAAVRIRAGLATA